MNIPSREGQQLVHTHPVDKFNPPATSLRQQSRYHRTINVLTAIVLLGFSILFVSDWLGLRLNTMHSVDPGFYWVVEKLPEKGDFVSFCPAKNSLTQMAHERGYIGFGNCPGHTERLIKIVYGTEGDSIELTQNGVKVNGALLPFSTTLPENIKHEQSPAMSPKEEFAEVLRSVNGDITGEHPIMDGQKHRFKVDGDKTSEKSGFYVGFLDGHPAGYVKNNRTGVEIKWKSKGYVLNEAEKAKLQAETAAKQQERNQKIIAQQQKTAVILSQLWALATTPPADHPYLAKKQVNINGLRIVPATTMGLPEDSPIKIGADKAESLQLLKSYENHPEILIFTAGDLLVPVRDTEDQLWSLQTIDPNGIKRFVKASKMDGGFYVPGGMAGLQQASVLVVAEGMATAKSLQDCLGFPVVAAFASGNLAAVVNQLHLHYPEKPVIVAGDDDRQLEAKHGINVGREKAEQAAKSVGGKAIFPVFAETETQLTDFNDLATQSVFGKAALDRQVKTVVAMEIEKQANQLDQLLEPIQGKEQSQTQRRAIGI